MKKLVIAALIGAFAFPQRRQKKKKSVSRQKRVMPRLKP